MAKTLIFVVNVDWFFVSHRLPIAIEAIRCGYKVHIVTTLTNKFEELERCGIVVHSLKMKRQGMSILNSILGMLQLFTIFHSVRPDIVHLVTIKPVLLGGLMARAAQVPCVVAAVSGLGFVFTARGWRSSIRRKIVSFFYRVALGHRNVKVIFQNPDDLIELSSSANLRKSNTVLIRGSGVDLTRFCFTPLPKGVPVVMLAARLLIDKGVGEFVQSAKLLKNRGCVARFVLVGAIDSANPTSFNESQVSSWALEGCVEYWGPISDMNSVLSSATIVVLPSYREGLPKVLIEAAACGRPVITTDVPGCRDSIQQGITGVLVPPYDAESLANAVHDLLSDPVRCKAMGESGRKFAESVFDVRTVINKHMEIYEELVKKI